VKFGIATTTLDAAGEIVDQRPMPVTRVDVAAAMPAFRRRHHAAPADGLRSEDRGRRLHEIARKGEEVERQLRPVHVDVFTLEDFTEGAYRRPGCWWSAAVAPTCARWPPISVRRSVGVRTSWSWRRLRVGSFALDEARPIEAIEADPAAALVPLAEAMRDLERVSVDAETALGVAHGLAFAPGTLAITGDGPYALVGEQGDLLAVYERRGAGCKPSVVVAPAGSRRSGAGEQHADRDRPRRPRGAIAPVSRAGARSSPSACTTACTAATSRAAPRTGARLTRAASRPCAFVRPSPARSCAGLRTGGC